MKRMQKIIATTVTAAFFWAAMPQSVAAGHYGGKNALIGLGIIGAVVSVIVWAVSGNEKDVAIEEIKARSVRDARNACGGIPCASGYDSSTAGSAKIWYQLQPITQNVRPSRSDNSDGGESPLYRAGVKAAQQGDESARTLCAGGSSDSDFCVGFRNGQ